MLICACSIWLMVNIFAYYLKCISPQYSAYKHTYSTYNVYLIRYNVLFIVPIPRQKDILSTNAC